MQWLIVGLIPETSFKKQTPSDCLIFRSSEVCSLALGWCSLKRATVRGSITNRPSAYLEPWPTRDHLKGISLEKCLIPMKKQPGAHSFYFLWHSIDPQRNGVSFHSLFSVWRSGVRVGHGGVPAIRESGSGEGRSGRCLLLRRLWIKTKWVKDALPKLNDTPTCLCRGR